MKNSTFYKAIRGRILAAPDYQLFCLADFLSISSYDSIRQSLVRIEKTGLIRRITNGIYQRASDHSNELFVEPSPISVAYALARNANAHLEIGTELARQKLGLSFINQDEFVYFTTELSCRCSFGTNETKTIRLIRNKSPFMTQMSPDCAVVTSALLDLDKHPITAEEVYHLYKSLSKETKDALHREKQFAPAKLRPVFDIICGVYGRTGR